MNSEERRTARRRRREEKRTANKAKRVAGCTLENVASLNSLYIAAKQSSRGVRWKASVQGYLINILRTVSYTHLTLPTNSLV